MKQLADKGMERDAERGAANLHLLHEPHELGLMVNLSRFPEVVEAAALNHEPHQLAHYLRELANDFHTYYNAHQFLVGDSNLRDARLNLILAARQVLHNGLTLLGVSAPESM
jgi:arginyl-tRNA synthetase